MSRKRRVKTEEEVDEIVSAQADDDAAWGEPVRVRRLERASLSLSAELAARAAFFARLHRGMSMEDWLLRIIQERIDFEEAAFAELKRIATK
ncbi:MAG TPA: hypothetical protein VJS44_17455 [Pyrinomonadaceae bacterium]|nr:hypothetical protein [Pyrinomonadaceae bacterium]